MATSTGNDLFNFRLFQDKEGVHLLLAGSLAKDFETLVSTLKSHCCCRWACGVPQSEEAAEKTA